MNKLFTKIVSAALGLTMAIGVGLTVASNSEAVPVHAVDEVFYTLTPAKGSNNSYAGDCDITIDGVTWNLTGNSTMLPWRIGGKSISNTARPLYSKTALNTTITKVEMELGAASSVTIVSSSFIAASDSNFTNVVDTVSLGTSIANKTTTIQPSAGKTWKDCYYKFVFNVTISVSSNKFVEFVGAKFYHEAATKTLSSVSVTTPPTKTTYYVGDSFDSTGMVVTASYSSGSPVEVTDKCTFSPATFTTTGNQNVTVSYTEGEVTKTTTQAVTVNAARTITGVTLLGDMTYKTYKDGDPWDVTGLYLSVTWSSGDPTTVQLSSLTKDTDYHMDPDSVSEGDTSVDIEGEYEGFAFSKTVTGITVSAAPDVLNRTLTGASGTTYIAWSGKAGSSGSGAVYAGNSAGGNDSIQLRVKSPAGIWTTTSGGIFSGISVTWNSSTADARSIEIYGKSSAYASADLYDNSKKGTLIGEIAKGNSTIEGDLGEYEYIGIKAKGGALYLTEIDIYWAAADPVIEYEDSSTTANLVVINGSTNTIDFNAKNFASISAGIFSNTPINSNSSYANLSYSVSGTTVTVTVTGKAVGSESFTISATGCANTLTLNVTVQTSTTFDSLVISTATTATSFNEDEAFAVTGLVVTANYTVGGSPSTVEFSASEENLEQLTYTVGGSPIEIGDPLASTGTLSVVVSYTDTATGTTRSASAYSITVNAYVAHTWTKVTTAPADWRGTYLLGYEKDGTFYAFNSSLATFDATFNTVNTTSVTSGVVTGSKALDAVAVKIERNTISKTSYYHALCANGEYLKSASKSINHQKTATEAAAVSFDGVELKIGDYWLRFNTANDQLRFRFGDSSYLSSTTASLYKMNVTDSINTEVSNFVSGFHSSIGGVCDASGVDTDTSALNSAWTTQATAFKALSVDAQGILANTTYIHNAETAGSTADIIDRYDYVYGKYSASLTKGDFMNRSDAGTLVTYSARVNPFNIIGNNGNTVAIIVVISMISVTCIGGYFFLRKRKEN